MPVKSREESLALVERSAQARRVASVEKSIYRLGPVTPADQAALLRAVQRLEVESQGGAA